MSDRQNQVNNSSNVLENLSQILFFHSWNKLIENEKFLGLYLNQPVYEIVRDNVVLIPDSYLTGLDKNTGKPFIFISGPGIYYVQFRLKPGMLVTDHREISGIILPIDYYDKAQDISGSLIDTEKLLMTELMIVIPFSLLFDKQTTQMYLRGVVTRNVIHPYKDCFNQLLDVCRNPNSITKEEGFKILSGGLSSESSIFANELLTEKEIVNYSKITAGIKDIKPKVKEILDLLQLSREEMKTSIFEKIRLIKRDFVEIGYPQLIDWMP